MREKINICCLLHTSRSGGGKKYSLCSFLSFIFVQNRQTITVILKQQQKKPVKLNYLVVVGLKNLNRQWWLGNCICKALVLSVLKNHARSYFCYKDSIILTLIFLQLMHVYIFFVALQSFMHFVVKTCLPSPLIYLSLEFCLLLLKNPTVLFRHLRDALCCLSLPPPPPFLLAKHIHYFITYQITNSCEKIKVFNYCRNNIAC